MRKSGLLSVLAGGVFTAALATPTIAADMTHDRAVNADREAHNWLLHHKNYQGYRHSTLNKINRDTVKNLRMAFAVALGGYQSGGRYAHGNLEGTPIDEDGMMYVTDGWGSVYAIDVSSGNRGAIKWKMDPGTDRAWAGDVACCGVNNRGVALWKDLVISVALDGRLIATKKETGEVVWERKVADPAIAETLTLAPLIVRDIAMVGVAGGEFGVRGWIDATDLNTGKQLWRTHTIPGKGEKGNETWQGDHNPWEHGGAPAWVTGTYDPKADITYWGTGNPGPDWDAEYRPGDNLWASSVLAIDPKNGEIKWGFQYTPNDPFDFDEVAEHTVVDLEIGGQPRQLVLHAARNGFYYALDRTNGSFVAGKAYVDQVNWTPGLDPKTGKPLDYDPTKAVQPYDAGTRGWRNNPVGRLCPSILGGKNWQPSAYSPELKLLYIPSIEGCNVIETKEQAHFESKGGTVKPRERFTGGAVEWPERISGAIKAVDPMTGDIKAQVKLTYPNYSGVLSTSGGLVFTGHYDGTLSAYDARTLQEVWSFNVGTGINAPPITYEVGGRQYVAVLAGSRMSPTVLGQAPELKNNSTASMLFVFGL